MKFTNIPEQPEQLPHLKTTSHSILDNFSDYKLYNNLAIYLMKPGAKVNFKDMSNIINNGKIATSWAIRINYLNNLWVLHIAPHPDVKINFDLYETINDLCGGIESNILGNPHLGVVQTKNKSSLETTVNRMIDKFSSIQIEGIENIPIDVQYTTASSDKKYKLPNFFYCEKFDEPTYQKYTLIISQLLKNKSIPEMEEVIRISRRMYKNKVLIKSDFDKINNLAEKYLNTNSKIKIALKYLASK